ncbi:bifunctional adenosylcobinamide kinase/adenosylcobinamide-phosphate guanylyltransferase [Metabacillus sp. KIGAM252]|uniref:Adenosylcobinamide kinase n=1 Tax=Metabacillus flavus TaxID=2823519 RepID=A0ABS5LDD0_9BACI|nr:bifunctional adenosylcobinamide kinase/adenosylcobinamide-phosphate guanylyltransferase [Metabacillus flavus]MBS2968707.1 bifunctional adenosylcobinamide kinase/adenosylcobinamide-phosphate guanylyltransferase [Metabacillus flavus]
MLIFISGGVRSGKSSFAERFAEEAAAGTGKLNYIAAGRASDKEMEHRIAMHQLKRNDSQKSWQTFEKQRNLHELAPHFSRNDILVLDCLTTWLNNEMFAPDPPEDPVIHMMMGIRMLRQSCGMLITVSNELSYDAHLYEESVLDYIKGLGRLHQAAVKEADAAYLVENGLAILKKGGQQ